MRQLIIFHRNAHVKAFGFALAQRVVGAHFVPSEGLSYLAYDGIIGGYSVVEMIAADYDPRRLRGKRYDLVTYDYGVRLDDKTRAEFEMLVR